MDEQMRVPNQEVSQQEEKPKKKKSKKKWIWISVILFIFVILPLGVVGYLGLFNIPGLTHLFGSDKPIDLGVEISKEAMDAGLAKTPFKKVENLPGVPDNVRPLDVDVKYTGSTPVENKITSEELTSFVHFRNPEASMLSDIQIKFNDGGAELSANLDEYINAPIYIKSDITTLEDKSLSFDIKNIKIGRFSIPSGYIDRVEEFATEFINERIDMVEGFSIKRLEFKDGFVDFKGTYPKKAQIIK